MQHGGPASVSLRASLAAPGDAAELDNTQATVSALPPAGQAGQESPPLPEVTLTVLPETKVLRGEFPSSGAIQQCGSFAIRWCGSCTAAPARPGWQYNCHPNIEECHAAAADRACCFTWARLHRHGRVLVGGIGRQQRRRPGRSGPQCRRLQSRSTVSGRRPGPRRRRAGASPRADRGRRQRARGDHRPVERDSVAGRVGAFDRATSLALRAGHPLRRCRLLRGAAADPLHDPRG